LTFAVSLHQSKLGHGGSIKKQASQTYTSALAE